jgi:hypothetical protein
MVLLTKITKNTDYECTCLEMWFRIWSCACMMSCMNERMIERIMIPSTFLREMILRMMKIRTSWIEDVYLRLYYYFTDYQ